MVLTGVEVDVVGDRERQMQPDLVDREQGRVVVRRSADRRRRLAPGERPGGEQIVEGGPAARRRQGRRRRLLRPASAACLAVDGEHAERIALRQRVLPDQVQA